MKIIKILVFVILGILIVVFVGGYFYVQYLKPQYDGEASIPGLQANVKIYFDEYGIPHIYGEHEEDVYRALGYVHAQDRLWQMELMRRIAPGRLSEVFGKELLQTDIFFRTLGINEYSENIKQEEGSKVSANAMAYLEGVNHFVSEGPTPIEYTLTGLGKTPFTLVDVHNVMGYMAYSFALAHRTDPIATQIARDFGLDYLQDLDFPVSVETTLLKNYPVKEDLTEISSITTTIFNSLPASIWIGSNSWIVNSTKSESRKVIFANDPHIGFSQPAVWYEAHLTTPDWEIYGYHLALQPFAILGHNQKMAVGLTMFENDDIDFYREQPNPDNPDQYAYNGEWLNYDIRKESIVVKDSGTIELTVRSTVHGPIVTDVIDDIDSEISMWWVYTKFPSSLLDVNYNLNHSTSLHEVQNWVSKIHAPGLNVMYGDAEGNIAWWAAAKLPIRPSHVNSLLFLDGSSDKDEPKAFLEFRDNPQAVNPPWNYVYSANNQPDSVAGMYLPGYYVPEDRAKQIVKLLESRDKLDVDFFKKMLLTNESAVAESNCALLTGMITPEGSVEMDALKILKDWKGTHEMDESGPVIYQKVIYHMLKGAIEDEIDSAAFASLLKTHLIKRAIGRLLNNPASKWWDDIKTDQIETQTDILNQAFKLAIADLSDQLGDQPSGWKWGEVHFLEHQHAFGTIEQLRGFFNVGPFEVGSTVEAINNLGFSLTGSGQYKVTFGPSTRRIVDFADVDNALSILPTGQSGNPFSPHYKDQAEMFVKGKFRKQLINRKQIEASSKSILLLTHSTE